MKKSNILIAVFAVIAAAPMVKAENINIDFDRGALKLTDLVEAVKREVPCEGIVSMPLKASSLEMVNAATSSKILELNKIGRQVLQESLVRDLTGAHKEISELVRDESSIILYNDAEIIFLSSAQNNAHNVIFKTTDTVLVRALMKFRAQYQAGNLQNKHWITKCKDVIDWVIRIVNGVEIATKVITKICEQEWVSPSNPNSGGIAPIPGASGIPGIHHERHGGTNLK